MTIYTTVAVDRYGKVYDLSREHPSWEAAQKAKRDGTDERCIVVDAFTCTVEACARLKARRGRS